MPYVISVLHTVPGVVCDAAPNVLAMPLPLSLSLSLPLSLPPSLPASLSLSLPASLSLPLSLPPSLPPQGKQHLRRFLHYVGISVLAVLVAIICRNDRPRSTRGHHLYCYLPVGVTILAVLVLIWYTFQYSAGCQYFFSVVCFVPQRCLALFGAAILTVLVLIIWYSFQSCASHHGIVLPHSTSTGNTTNSVL
eukprot:3940242-Rhodomonas_salina.1